jgi:hypothetical protein
MPLVAMGNEMTGPRDGFGRRAFTEKGKPGHRPSLPRLQFSLSSSRDFLGQ